MPRVMTNMQHFMCYKHFPSVAAQGDQSPKPIQMQPLDILHVYACLKISIMGQQLVCSGYIRLR